MSVGEYEEEPVRGLPDYLPPGEDLLWQGEPDFRTLAESVFYLRRISIYFAFLILVHLGFQLSGGAGVVDVLLGSSWMIGLGVCGLAIIATLAWAYARSTVYTITSKRVVIRSGVAMPMMINIPLPVITAADMRHFRNGAGDIVLSLQQQKRLSYLFLWPNVKAWKFSPTLPALVCLTNVDEAAAALAQALEGTRDNTLETAEVEPQREATAGALLGAS